MSLSRKIAYNTLVSAGARIISIALALINIGLITRYLGISKFGDYTLVLVFVYIFSIFADLGLYSLLTREISRENADEKKITSNIFTLRLVASGVFLSLAPVAGYFFPYSSFVKTGLILGAIMYFFLSLAQVITGVFQKYLKMDKVALAEFFSKITQVGFVILFVKLNLGFFAILAASVVAGFVNFAVMFKSAKKYINFGLDFDFGYWKKILKTAFPIAVSLVFTLLYFKIDAVFLSLKIINRSSPDLAADVGIYGVGYRVLESIIFFPAMFLGLVMPLLSKYVFLDKIRFQRIFQKTLDILLITATPLLVGGMFLAEPLIILVAGPEFKDSAQVLRILLFAVWMIFVANLFGNTIIALNKQKKSAWIYFAGAVFNIGTNLVFIPKYSYLGAASTTVATEILVTVLLFLVIIKNISFFPSFKIVLKSLFACFLMGIFLYFNAGKNIFLLLGAGVVIYFAVLYLIKGISKQDIKTLLIWKRGEFNAGRNQ